MRPALASNMQSAEPNTPAFRHTLADFAMIQRQQGEQLVETRGFRNSTIPNALAATPAPRRNRLDPDKLEAIEHRQRADFTPLSERASPPLPEQNNRYLNTLPAQRKMTEQHESTPSPIKARRNIRNLPN